jgi:hypothetical protein
MILPPKKHTFSVSEKVCFFYMPDFGFVLNVPFLFSFS